VIGLGASAGLHYAGLAPLVGNECIIPSDADVANALGAVVGQVRVHVGARVSQPREGLFRLAAGDEIRDFVEETDAITQAEHFVRDAVRQRAAEAGADTVEIEVHRDIRTSTIEGQRMFLDADIVATASGRPRLAL
jgi:N-methylhydantoinase A/oxoprolinase/acetone carboxylase beta subunit